MGDSEKKLIRAVKRHTCLYKKDEIGFRDRLKRERSWKSVAVECGLSAKQSKCRWRTLRDRFVRELHKDEEERNWKYFKDLYFLYDHIQIRNVETEMASDMNEEAEVSANQLEFGDLEELKTDQDPGEDTLSELPPDPHTEYVIIMGLLENVLLKKQNEERELGGQHSDACQDPFYKYHGTILSRVDDDQRADIQLEILNFANGLVKKASKTS